MAHGRESSVCQTDAGAAGSSRMRCSSGGGTRGGTAQGGGRGAREGKGEVKNGRGWIKAGRMGQRREKKFRSSVENVLGEHHKVLLTK